MSKQSQIILLIVLLGIFIGLWVTMKPLSSLKEPPPAQKPTSDRVSQKPVETQSVASPDTDTLFQPGPLPPSAERDPFKLSPYLMRLLEAELQSRQAEEKARLEDIARKIELQGVFWNLPQPKAIVNRRILSVGDQIEGAKVMGIGKEGVTFGLEDGQTFIKSLPGIRSKELHR